MRNGSLWSDIVFEKEVFFHEFDFETSCLELEISKSSIWTHTISCDKGVFFISVLCRNFDDRLSSIFHRLVILCICWDTTSVKTSLWQLPIVSTVFNYTLLKLETKAFKFDESRLNFLHIFQALCLQQIPFTSDNKNLFKVISAHPEVVLWVLLYFQLLS